MKLCDTVLNLDSICATILGYLSIYMILHLDLGLLVAELLADCMIKDDI